MVFASRSKALGIVDLEFVGGVSKYFKVFVING